MAKYALLMSLDLNIDFMDSTVRESKGKNLEKIAENKIRILVDGKRGCEIKNLGIKLLGKAEKFDG